MSRFSSAAEDFESNLRQKITIQNQQAGDLHDVKQEFAETSTKGSPGAHPGASAWSHVHIAEQIRDDSDPFDLFSTVEDSATCPGLEHLIVHRPTYITECLRHATEVLQSRKFTLDYTLLY